MRLNQPRPLVSVVVIFLNEARFLAEAVQSVIDQSYPDWELLLVDDGSSDGSSEIAREFARAQPGRIRYLEHPDHASRGISPSRNLGLRQTRGELIALLDADDRWLPNKLAEQVRILGDRPNVGMVYGATEYWFSWTGSPDDAARDYVRSLGLPAGSVLRPPQLLELMIPRIVPSPGLSSVLVRREVAESVGFFEDEFTGLYDDQVFIAKVSLATQVYASDRCWYRYRQHPSSFYAGLQRAGARTAGRRKYLRWLDLYLERQGYGDAPIRAVAREEMGKLSLPLAQRVAGKISRRAPRAYSIARELYERWLPSAARDRAASLVRARSYFPPAGGVHLGDLRRLTPISRKAGEDRGGRSVSRYYVERFLESHGGDLEGRVLEVGDGVRSHLSGKPPVAQPVSPRPLTARVSVERVSSLEPDPDGAYNCVVLTDLHRSPNPRAVLDTIVCLLRPGGVVLAAVPGISQVVRSQFDQADDFWRFTERSVRELFAASGIEPEVRSHGNVLAATAQLHGFAADELRPVELAYADPDFPVVITVRAVRAEAPTLAVGSGESYGAAAVGPGPVLTPQPRGSS